MNLQAHIVGQFSGQVSNQAGTSLPAMPQQQNMLQNSGTPRNTLNMEPGVLKARQFIQERIYDYLMRRQQALMRRQQAQEMAPRRVLDIVRRLEEILFKSATSKEEYLNLETLENRLHILITKRLPLSNPNQQYQQQGNASAAIGTMIPTPGMHQSGNSSLTAQPSLDNSFVATNGGNSMVSSAINTGNFVQGTTRPSSGMHGGSFGPSDGGLTNGYQQSTSNFPTSSGGNNLVSSADVQRIASQMIPAPGFNNNSNSSSNQSYMNLDSSNNVVGLSSVDSTMVRQPLQHKQQVGGQNSRILHSFMGGGIRSSLHQKTYGLSSGSLNGGLGMVGNNLQTVNSSGNQANLHNTPPTANPKSSINHSEKMGVQSQQLMRESAMLSQQPLHFQQQLQDQHHQNQHLSYGQPQLTSDPNRGIQSEPRMEFHTGPAAS